MLKGYAPVNFIQGAAFKYEIQFDEQSYQYVTSVHISCRALNFCHKLDQDKSNPRKWYHLFDAEESKSLRPVKTTYNITVYSSIEELNPQILANQTFEVVRNSNPSCGEV